MAFNDKTITDDQQQRAAAQTESAVEACTMVLFGASGDLTQRMIMPAIFRLARRGLLTPDFRLIGYARSQMTDDEFRERMRVAVMRVARAGDEEAWPEFAARLHYISAAYDGDGSDGYLKLSQTIEKEGGPIERRLFYLATPPSLFAPIVRRLSDAGLAGRAYKPAEGGWARLIIEKPFGHDLASGRALNADVGRSFDENDVYRIDHFLGKEGVQSLFALRFANGIFEPVWNRNYIDHVQITASETLGMEGRGSYYETAGALRDMVQNHLLQICALVALEPPAEWNPRAVRDEKVKVLRSVRQIEPENVENYAVRGQYREGMLGAQHVDAYRHEKDVATNSSVETFAALKLYVDNWRWAGVPFYLRSGKRLAATTTEIVIAFKAAPHAPWRPSGTLDDALRPNLLVVNVSPAQGLFIRVEAKLPGQEMRMQSIRLDYCHPQERSEGESPSAYEHLLLDCMRGDPTFFARSDEVEAAWKIVEPVVRDWEAKEPPDFPNYSAGSSGPVGAESLLAHDGRRWLTGESQPTMGSVGR